MNLQILVERPDARPRDDFNAALRLGLGEAAHRDGVARLVVHLIDDEAAVVGAGDLANAPSFDAWIGVGAASGADERARDAVLEVARDVGACHVYRVDARVVAAHPELATGERTPGVVMASAVRAADGLDAAAFDAHWSERHAPLATKHHPGMWDYRQLAVREVLSSGSPAWDGFALMGFPSADAFRTGLFDSPEGREIILADTARFLALDRGETAMMGEYWLRAGLD